MASILDEIYASKRIEVRAQRAIVSPMAIAARARDAAPPRDFVGALRSKRPAIIAEIKRASPSRGDIMPGLDPAIVAREYADGGAAAISVLTDRHFKGSLDDLRAVRAAVATSAQTATRSNVAPIPEVKAARARSTPSRRAALEY